MAQNHFPQSPEENATATIIGSQDAEAYSALGLVLMAQGHIKEAENALRQTFAIQPDFAEAHH